MYEQTNRFATMRSSQGRFSRLALCVAIGLLVLGHGRNDAESAESSAFGFQAFSSRDYGLELDSEALQDARDSAREALKRTFTAGAPSAGGEHVWVLDDYLSEEGLETARSYLMGTTWWGFKLTGRDGKDQEAGGDGVPWGARINTEDFSRLATGRELQMLATTYRMGLGDSSTNGNDDDDVVDADDIPYLLPYEVTYKVVRRGDLTSIHYGSPEEIAENEVWMMLFLNDEWRANNYGDVIIYDGDKEIIGGASNLFARLLVWKPSLGYLCRPPSIGYSQGENILMVKWTTNTSKCLQHEKQRRADRAEIESGIVEGFPFRSASDLQVGAEVDVGKHEVLRRLAPTGKRIVAFDDLFTDEELLALRSYVMSHGKVFYDDSIDAYSDNVQWISGFEVHYFVQSKFWKIIKNVAAHVSDGADDWYPYDISCNIIRSYDHTRIHGDVRNERDDEWTFLLYLSPMDENDFGETAFFTSKTDKTETVYQVRPRYGRSVIFEGLIPHAARPPSPKFKGPRYSFA
eukprot:scpid74740/ scgid7894/ 